MSPQDRNIPPATSPLKGPTLTPAVTPLKVGDGPQTNPGDSGNQDTDESSSGPPARKPARKGRRLAPAVADSVALTVRVDPDEADEIDTWLLALRKEAGRTRLDKSEVLRALLVQAREHDPTRKALLRRLR